MTADPAVDIAQMRAALGLARRGLGNVWPNPAVGCVIVNDGRIVGRGWTQPGGRPHAETEALRRAGPLARGGTAYVSLEPCAHWGRTPPCADALIEAGIARAVVALDDPDPRVAGRGLARLRAAGIEVTTEVCTAEAAELNAGFLSRVERGRPLIALKLATTLDGHIATASGESRWITGPASRSRVHLLRARYDAILVGTGTALADDPKLTCRLPGIEDRSPVRIILDRQLRLPLSAKVLSGGAPTWVVSAPDSDRQRRKALAERGIDLIDAPLDPGGRLDLAAAMAALGARGLTRLLVEGGARLAAALLQQGLVDRLHWFHAPRLFGADGLPAIAALMPLPLANLPAFERLSVETLGEDVLTTMRFRP